MSAKVFNKLKGLACAFAAGVVSFGFFYSVQLARVQEVELQRSFYFLVSTDSRIEVSAEFIKLDGGAGYLLTEGKARYVALSVYLDKEEGLTVREELDEGQTTLVHKGVSTLYFKGKDKKKSTLYLNALRTLEGYMYILNECISRLEKGTTQESCKRILSILQRQFAFAQEEYKGYPAFSKSCEEWSGRLATLCAETIYVSDLRYLLCEQAEGYLRLCEEFRI